MASAGSFQSDWVFSLLGALCDPLRARFVPKARFAWGKTGHERRVKGEDEWLGFPFCAKPPPCQLPKTSEHARLGQGKKGKGKWGKKARKGPMGKEGATGWPVWQRGRAFLCGGDRGRKALAQGAAQGRPGFLRRTGRFLCSGAQSPWPLQGL